MSSAGGSGAQVERYGNVVVTRSGGRTTIETSSGVITVGPDGTASVAGTANYTQTPQGNIIIQTNEGPLEIPVRAPAASNVPASNVPNITQQVQTTVTGSGVANTMVSVSMEQGGNDDDSDEYETEEEEEYWSQDDDDEMTPQPQRPAVQRRQQRRVQNQAMEQEPELTLEPLPVREQEPVLTLEPLPPQQRSEPQPEPEAEAQPEPQILPEPITQTNPRYRRTNRPVAAPAAEPAGARPSTEFIAIHKERPPLTETKYLAEDLAENWREIYSGSCVSDENVFYETKAYYAARKCLYYRGWVTITGMVGDGKTAMAKHMFLHFVKSPRKVYSDAPHYDMQLHKKYSIDEENRECYKAIVVKSPEDWKQKVNTAEQQVVLIDDIFGPAAYTIDFVEKWQPILEDVMLTAIHNCPKTLVIITVHKQHIEKLPDEVRKLEFFKPQAIIDLTESTHRLDSNDKEQILRQNCSFYYHGLSNREVSELMHFNLHNSFPLSCRMFSGCRTFHVEGNRYFQNPWRYVENEIDKAFKFDKILYLTLTVAILNDGELDLDMYSFSEYDASRQKVFRECIQIIGAPPDTDLGMMRYAARLLTGFYFVPYKKFGWKFNHERTQHLVAQSVHRKIGSKLIELCSLKFITERLRTSSYFGATNESCIMVMFLEYEPLCQRVTYEILSGHVRLMAQHICFAEDRFAPQWFQFMRNMGSLHAVLSMKDKVLNRSFFYWCCYYGGGPVVKEILGSEDLQDLRSEPWFVEQFAYCLQAACCCPLKGAGISVEALLKAGADINGRENYEGENVSEVFSKEIAYLMRVEATPIHFAAQTGNFTSVKHLIAKGANINEPAKDCFTPLHRAAGRPSPEAAQALIDAKADINKATPLGRTPIHEAIACGSCRVVEAFVKAGIDIKKGAMDDGRSLLSVACGNNQSDLVYYLLREGCNPDGNTAKDLWGPLHMAVGTNNKDMADALLRDKANVNLKASGGWTPLHLAVLFHYEKLICLLIEKEADINATAYDKKTPLHVAAAQGYFDCCNMLLDRGAKPDGKTNSGETPVTLAGKGGFGMLCKMLINEGIETESSGGGRGSRDMMMDPMMMMRHPMYRDMMYRY